MKARRHGGRRGELRVTLVAPAFTHILPFPLTVLLKDHLGRNVACSDCN